MIECICDISEPDSEDPDLQQFEFYDVAPTSKFYKPVPLLELVKSLRK